MVEVSNSSEPDDTLKGLGIRCGRMKPRFVMLFIVMLILILHIQFNSRMYVEAEDEELTIVKKDFITVGNFKDTYYLNETGWAYVYRHLHINGSNMTENKFPVIIRFIGPDWYKYNEIEINEKKYRNEIIGYKDRYQHYPIYSYHDIDLDVGFSIETPGKYNVTTEIRLNEGSGYSERDPDHFNSRGFIRVEVQEQPPEPIWPLILLAICIIIGIILVFKYSIRPIKNAHKKYIQDKINERKIHRDTQIDDLRSMIQIAYQRGGITSEEMQIFERRRKEMGLSQNEFQEMFR